jgi:hypothetical protein
MTDTAPAVSQTTGDIIARASTMYRAKWCVMGFALLAYGWWSLYDGYVKYPRLNAEAAGRGLTVLPHGGYDIPLNRLFGFALQPLGAIILAWAFYSSRGQYRLVGDTLHAPGHPPVGFGDIRAIDQSKWDRKGIAIIEYDVNGKTGALKLDDYLYEREPTDQIYDRILAAVAPEDAAVETSPEEANS